MPKAWSDAVKACNKHPRKVRGRWCNCNAGWRYRMRVPDPVTGAPGPSRWSQIFPTRDLADRDQQRVRKAIQDGSYISDRGLTVAKYLRAWVDGKERSGRKASTVAGYRAIIENHLVPTLGRHRLGALRPHHVQALIDRLEQGPSLRNGAGASRPVSPGTVSNIRSVLRAALSDAVRQQLVSRNVATLVSMPAGRRRPPTALTAAEVAEFLRRSEGQPLHALWFMAAVYGMRRAELIGLRWADIDPDGHVFWVRQTVVDVPGEHPCMLCGGSHLRLKFDTPKSAAGERVYPLVPAVEEVLSRHRLRQDDERAACGADWADHGLVFAQSDGNPWRPDYVSQEFRRLIKLAAPERDRPPSLKSLRSTMVTNLHEAGTPLEVISKVTGHAGGEVTRDHYLSVSAERTRNEFAAVAARFRDPTLTL